MEWSDQRDWLTGGALRGVVDCQVEGGGGPGTGGVCSRTPVVTSLVSADWGQGQAAAGGQYSGLEVGDNGVSLQMFLNYQ